MSIFPISIHIFPRKSLLIALLGSFAIMFAKSLQSQIKFEHLSTQTDVNKRIAYSKAFYDKRARVATVNYLLRSDVDYAYLNLLEVEEKYRNIGLGSVIFKQIMRDIAHNIKKERLAVKLVKWFASPFDPPAGVSHSEMRTRLYGFYRRQGAKVDDTGNAELDLVAHNYL